MFFSEVSWARTFACLAMMERHFIAICNSKHPNGYNMIGGRKTRDRQIKQVFSKETKAKIDPFVAGQSVKISGHTPWNKGLKGFLKGRTPWNKGLTGINCGSKKGTPAWNKGLTKETDPRVAGYAESLSNSESPNVFKKGQAAWNKGLTGIYTMPEEAKAKISRAFKGVPKSPETRQKMVEAWNIRRTKQLSIK